MERIAEFERISEQEYQRCFRSLDPEASDETIRDAYEKVSIPVRATQGSAGYDLVSPVAIFLRPGEEITVPTGLRVRMEPGWVLMIVPRSGLGTRYRLQLNNTAGIIDSDYYYSENEGHILVRVCNDSKEPKTLELEAGSRFVQGLFLPFGITVSDEAGQSRNGGFGSTG